MSGKNPGLRKVTLGLAFVYTSVVAVVVFPVALRLADLWTHSLRDTSYSLMVAATAAPQGAAILLCLSAAPAAKARALALAALGLNLLALLIALALVWVRSGGRAPAPDWADHLAALCYLAGQVVFLSFLKQLTRALGAQDLEGKVRVVQAVWGLAAALVLGVLIGTLGLEPLTWLSLPANLLGLVGVFLYVGLIANLWGVLWRGVPAPHDRDSHLLPDSTRPLS